MSSDGGRRDYSVGYGKPPVATRFARGRSGNPRGRPRGRRNGLPYETVLGQMVTIRVDGIERRVTASEAFLLYITQRGIEGDGPAARAAMAAIEEARALRRAALEPNTMHIFSWAAPETGSVSPALIDLHMGRKQASQTDNPRIVLEPWLVQMAVDRLGDRRLTLNEQAAVFAVTRAPHRVRWPDWWEVKT